MRLAKLSTLALLSVLLLVVGASGASAALGQTAMNPDLSNGLSGMAHYAHLQRENGGRGALNVDVDVTRWNGFSTLPLETQENIRHTFRPEGVPLSANVRASDPAGGATGITNAEVAITADNLGHVLVAWNDAQGFLGSTTNPPNTLTSLAYSSDNGTTFTDYGSVPRTLTTDQAYGDCTLDHDGHGNFYLSSLYTPNLATLSPFNCAVWRGTFSGAIFTLGAPVMSATGASLDKNWIVADKSAALGKVYVLFSSFASSVTIMCATSTNGGATWGSPVTIQAGPTPYGHPSGVHPALDNAGNIYAAWEGAGAGGSIFCDISSGADDAIYFAKSINSGASFSAPQVVATLSNFNNFGSGPGNLRNRLTSFPDIAVDNSGGPRNGEIYVTWAECAEWAAPFATGIAVPENAATLADSNGVPGASGVKTLNPGDNATGTLAVSGGDIDYWKINLTAGQHLVVRLEPQGFNCGVTGTTRNFITRMYATQSRTDVSPPESLLASSNQSRFASGYEFDVQRTGQYLLRVSGGGSGTQTGTYTLKTRLATFTSPNVNTPARDARDVMCAFSTDGGNNWSNKVRVNDSPFGYDEQLPFITVDHCGQAWVFYFDRRENDTAPHVTYEGQLTDIYCNTSTDGGNTWSAGKRVTDQSSFFNPNSNGVPNLGDYNNAVSVGAYVYPAWSDERISIAGTAVYTPAITYPSGSGPDAYTTKFSAGCLIDAVQMASVAAVAQHGYVDITWTAYVSGAARFQVYRAAAGSNSFSKIGDEIVATGATQYSVRDASVQPGADYLYRVAYTSDGSNWSNSNSYRVQTPAAVFAFRSIHPNPTAGQARLDYEIARTGQASLEIFNVSGSRVRTIFSGVISAGQGSANWDGRDQNGRVLGAGAYFARLSSGGQVLTQRVMVLR